MRWSVAEIDSVNLAMKSSHLHELCRKYTRKTAQWQRDADLIAVDSGSLERHPRWPTVSCNCSGKQIVQFSPVSSGSCEMRLDLIFLSLLFTSFCRIRTDGNRFRLCIFCQRPSHGLTSAARCFMQDVTSMNVKFRSDSTKVHVGRKTAQFQQCPVSTGRHAGNVNPGRLTSCRDTSIPSVRLNFGG